MTTQHALPARQLGSETTWSCDEWEAENPNGNWDRKGLQILQNHQGTLKQKEGQESIHINASPESVSMICKLIEPVVHLSILIAVDDLREETRIEAQENNTEQVKLTPRVRESCAAPEATDPFCRRKKRKKSGKKQSPTTAQASNRQKNTAWNFSSFTMRNSPKDRVTSLQFNMGQYMITNLGLDEAGDEVRHCGAFTNSKDQPDPTFIYTLLLGVSKLLWLRPLDS